MKLTIYGGIEDRRRGDPGTYAFSEHGSDVQLRLAGIGYLSFDTVEEAEGVAAAIVLELAKRRLPGREAPSDLTRTD